jgi:hypothetical protein
MKTKQEKALVILEALEQADESLVQQALDVDNAEKFRSLGPVRLARNERPGKARLGLIAACLALVITLAAFPWLLSKLPVYNRPTEPTEPPIPPTTGFTEEYDPSEPPQLLVYNSSTSLFPIITGYDWYCDRDWENIVIFPPPGSAPSPGNWKDRSPGSPQKNRACSFVLNGPMTASMCVAGPRRNSAIPMPTKPPRPSP